MPWYIAVSGLDSRRKFIEMADYLQAHGFDDRVEYSSGGWADYMMHVVAPHLKFENEDDAIAYVLAFGGEVSTELPIRLT